MHDFLSILSYICGGTGMRNLNADSTFTIN